MLYSLIHRNNRVNLPNGTRLKEGRRLPTLKYLPDISARGEAKIFLCNRGARWRGICEGETMPLGVVDGKQNGRKRLRCVAWCFLFSLFFFLFFWDGASGHGVMQATTWLPRAETDENRDRSAR